MQKLSPIEVNEICDELGETYPKSIEQVHGGDIHSAWQIEFSNKKLFLKRNVRNKKFLKFEKYCLQNLREHINQKNFSIINLNKLNDFKDNDTVNLDSLVKKGLIFKPKFPLKILGNGKLNVKLKVQAHAFTKVAKQKIEEAGGTCELINNK